VNTARRVIHVRINDAETGQPTPARVQFKTSDGEYLQPLGRLADFATGEGEDVGGNLLLGEDRYAYVEGSFEILLPSVPVSVSITKGPEYKPVATTAQVGPGKMALRFTLERWTNLPQKDWYSGDSRAHFISPHAALLEAAAEDLTVVNLLVLETDEPWPSIPNILSFSGQRPALELPGHIVVVNTLNQHEPLGRLGLLNCHRPVYPLRAGARWGWENWRLEDWCNQCHRKGGLVVWCGGGNQQGAWLADAFEVTELGQESLIEWYQHLNSGRRLPLMGGSGKGSNAKQLGSLRTYAQLNPGEGFSYKNWIEAVRAGRTFVTKGPLIDLSVNGFSPGAVLPEPVVHVRAEAQGMTPFQHLQILAGGKVVAEAAAERHPYSVLLEAKVELPTAGWVAAACPGSAHSSPIYVGQSNRCDL
jgi:hypothetical protein